MLQTDNTSPFAVQMLGFADREGVETLYVVIKGTFCVEGDDVRVAEEQLPVTLADEYRSEPATSSLVRASEAHGHKPGTDVVVIGDACAPDERPVSHVDVGVRVGDRLLYARVHGERYWTEGLGGVGPSRAAPFVRAPVTYERAFGGRHVPELPEPSKISVHPSNPVGRGFLGKRAARDLLGQPAPCIEALDSPIRAPASRGTPVGFGPVAPSWEPRRQYAGTYDERWKKTRAPYLPTDFDPRFFHVAPESLVFVDGLRGGEPVALQGFHPRGTQRFALPHCELDIRLTLAGGEHRVPYRLETVALEPTKARFSMSWRASLAVDKQLLRVNKATVRLNSLDIESTPAPREDA